MGITWHNTEMHGNNRLLPIHGLLVHVNALKVYSYCTDSENILTWHPFKYITQTGTIIAEYCMDISWFSRLRAMSIMYPCNTKYSTHWPWNICCCVTSICVGRRANQWTRDLFYTRLMCDNRDRRLYFPGCPKQWLL